MNETLKLTTILTVICILAGVSLALVYQSMNPIIQDNKLRELRSSLEEVVPLADSFEEAGDIQRYEGIVSIFRGLKDNQRVGYAILLEAQGYGGNIKVLVGVDKDKNIIGMKISEHLETPGLGARIEEREFLDQFIADAVTGATKPVDAITGATVSSTAVIDAVNILMNSINIELD